MSAITVVGLGPGSPALLTRGAVAALQGGAPVFLRTAVHPVVPALADLGVSYTALDDEYERGADFAAVYGAIVARLLDQAAQGDLVYAVPGHPLVGEETVRLLLDQAPARGIRVELAGGPSFLDALLTALRLDPVGGLELLDAMDLEQRPPAGDLPSVIMQMYDRQVAGTVKLTLMETYPDEHPVTVVRAAGVPELERCEVIPLHELDRLPWVDHLTSLYVPPVAERGTRRHPLDPLVQVMARLRGPDGCPWDREQTHRSLRPYMLEEAYEAVEAIDAGDPAKLRDELGDVLLQVVFHAQMAREQGDFAIDDVVAAITAKLIRRHPHVFGDVNVSGSADVVRNWEAIKAAEQGDTPRPASLLAGMGKAHPALARAYAVQKKAAKVGFDWPDVGGALAKVAEELEEVRRAQSPAQAEDEVGDLLFAAVNVSRMLGVDPEVALSGTVAKFMRRFAYIEAEASRLGRNLEDMTLAEMDAIWAAAKKAL